MIVEGNKICPINLIGNNCQKLTCNIFVTPIKSMNILLS